jgi:hypothetical protein
MDYFPYFVFFFLHFSTFKVSTRTKNGQIVDYSTITNVLSTTQNKAVPHKKSEQPLVT